MSTPAPHVSNLIDGRLRAPSGDEELLVLDPSSEAVIGRLVDSTAADVDAAVAAAAAAQPGWAATLPGARADRLRAVADAVEAHLEELVQLEVADAGKPVAACRDGELPAIVDALRHFGATGRSGMAQAAGEYVEGTTTYLRREPVGVVAAVTPWNFPLWQAVWKLAPALAAGNAVVVKPAEATPLSTLRFAELAAEVLPPGVLNVVNGRGPTAGAALVAHPGVALVSFTGSTRAGREIASAAGRGPKPLILELGGNAPVLLFDDVDLEAAIPVLANCVLYNAGQECMSATRLLVQEGLRDRLVPALLARLAEARLGDASDPATTLGPLISAAQRERVQGFVDRLPAGAEILAGGRAPDRPGFFYEPTLIAGVGQADEIVQEEIFGPVATIQTFADEAEAIALGNDVAYGLAASVWTRDVARALRCVNALHFGNVWVNAHMAVGPDMPIGGFRASGYGKEGGQAGSDAFTRVKQVVLGLA